MKILKDVLDFSILPVELVSKDLSFEFLKSASLLRTCIHDGTLSDQLRPNGKRLGPVAYLLWCTEFRDGTI
jgi:hypothetical protein